MSCSGQPKGAAHEGRRWELCLRAAVGGHARRRLMCAPCFYPSVQLLVAAGVCGSLLLKRPLLMPACVAPIGFP